MKLPMLCVAFAALVGTAAVAEAAKIRNMDTQSYRLTVIQGETQSDIEIAPNQELDNICSEPCQIVVEGDPEPYEIEVSDNIQIEDGGLYFSEDAAPAQ